MSTVLRLEAREFAGPTRWRWVLISADGLVISDHLVQLDSTSWQFEAFTDLVRYLRWHVAPDGREAEEARIVAELGDWVGAEVLGQIAGTLAAARPVTVSVVVPAAGRTLLRRPLDLAHYGGRPLLLSGVTFVYEAAAAEPRREQRPAPDAPVRVLGLFSVPVGGQPVNLRQERQALVATIEQVAASGRAVEARVLQYGITRDSLAQTLAESEGWDVIHISGHGMPGDLLLERPDGAPDPVSVDGLADILRPARPRVRLITLSACSSADVVAMRSRLLPGTSPARGRISPDTPAVADELDGPQGEVGLAESELADRLGCAVLAMRYPLADDFATEFFTRLYSMLIRRGQPLPRAVGLALGELTTSSAYAGLSLYSPALFGADAIDLRLGAPPENTPPAYNPADLKMAGFPAQPYRFVGRTEVMARASTALAAESGVPGVLLHGMPGGGKTACALELAYTHEHAFDQLVWFKAPDDDMDVSGALADFALTLENELPGFQLAHLLADSTKPDPILPALTALTDIAQRQRILIVIDNIESLLSDDGQWRDDRWARIIGALGAQQGRGRVVLTSRRIPAATDEAGFRNLLVLPVDALSPDETLLLARSLPQLNHLITGQLPGVEKHTARQLALGVLNVAQGHPKLLELADGQAGDPERLAALVEAGSQAWRAAGGLPEGFFSGGPIWDARGSYLDVLAAWTAAVAETLAAGEQTLFQFLCCLEEPDRERFMLDANWGDLWRRLGHANEPPELNGAMAKIIAAGLATVRSKAADALDYAVHPGVAAAGRAAAGHLFRVIADTEAAAFWDAVFRHASGENDDGAVDTQLMVRAGLGAAPYLLRLEQWHRAGFLLDKAFSAEPTRSNAATVLPVIEQIAAREPYWTGMLARVLGVIDPVAAEKTLRRYLTDVVERGDYAAASAAAGQLMDLCRVSGRLSEALDIARQKTDYTRRAGLGPWTQLLDEVRRLQVLNAMGQAGEVLRETQRLLRARPPDASAKDGPNELVNAWDVQEVLLDTGRYAAVMLGQWQDALDLNAQQLDSLRNRAAPITDIELSRFNDYGPLLRLGQVNAALDLLLECRRVFEDAHDLEMLGKTLSALADTENARARGGAAISLERDALRYNYLSGDVTVIADSYHNLGNYLARYARSSTAALAFHLLSALIRTVIGAQPGLGADAAILAAAEDLRRLGKPTVLPGDVKQLTQLAEAPGTSPQRLIMALTPDARTADDALGDITARVRDIATAPGDWDTDA